jgi:hypothetical protein
VHWPLAGTLACAVLLYAEQEESAYTAIVTVCPDASQRGDQEVPPDNRHIATTTSQVGHTQLREVDSRMTSWLRTKVNTRAGNQYTTKQSASCSMVGSCR